MPLLLASLALCLQILCGVHAVRTGRRLYWLLIIIAAPFLGSLIYFLAEMLPDLMGSRAARELQDSFTQAIDPDHRLRALRDRLETADTVANKHALAAEHLRRGEPHEALPLLESALIGLHRDDPMLLATLARARFDLGRYTEATKTLEELKAANPTFEGAAAHLLYARCLEAEGRRQEAKAEYEAVCRYFPGVEARCRYALFLERQGEKTAAAALYREVVRALEKAGRHFIRDQREWYEMARRGLD
jgi:hypothetical protein